MSLAFVQSKSTSGTGTINQTFDSVNVLGNAIVVAVAASANGLTFAVSDTQGNTYSSLASFVGSGGVEIQVFYCLSAKAGANTVTFTPGSSVATILVIHEFSRLTAFDVAQSAAGTGANPDSGGATTASANEMLFGVIAGLSTGGTAIAPGAGWTQAESAFSPLASAISFISEWQIVASTGTYDATAAATLGKSGTYTWGAEIACFSASSGNVPRTLMMMGIGG